MHTGLNFSLSCNSQSKLLGDNCYTFYVALQESQLDIHTVLVTDHGIEKYIKILVISTVECFSAVVRATFSPLQANRADY